MPLSKYELTRVLGARAMQLTRGAAPRLTPPPHVIDPLDIALAELQACVLDTVLQRVLPDGTAERWSVQELRALQAPFHVTSSGPTAPAA